MHGRRILILFGTSHGQTAKIAQRMADRLEAAGDSVTLVGGDEPFTGLTLNAFDGVIIGSSITYGHHQRRVHRFAGARSDVLNDMPSAFFSVSGAAGSPDRAAQGRARQYRDEFLRTTGWRPQLAESIAGAMAYTKYNPLLRWVIKRISRRSGGPTDTSRDHEFTDWAQVERFVDAFASTLPRREAPPPITTVTRGLTLAPSAPRTP